jgi:vancomycin resistance protein YoaR
MIRWLEAKYSRQNLVLLTEFDASVARGELQRIATFVEQPTVNAEIDLIKRRRINARTGRRLDIDATLERLERLRDIEMTDFELVVREIIPQVTDERLTPIDFDKVLSSFETDFRTRAGPRAINIRVAARALNGYVISPNEVFSFNRVIGPRTENRGYREAPVIVDDELEPGVGGGVCQVATTLHAAIVLAGFEVMERRSHSRPSGYAPMGLDATVLDGGVDLKFRNPYRIPLLIATNFPDRFRLRVEVLGMLPTKKLKHAYHVKKKYDFYRRLITKDNLPFGSYERKQKGNFGYDVVSTIQAIDGEGESKFRQYRSKYWPVPEVYWIGPGTELNQLPALPDGAIGVQRDGVTVFGNIPKDVEERTMNGGGDDFDNPGGV